MEISITKDEHEFLKLILEHTFAKVQLPEHCKEKHYKYELFALMHKFGCDCKESSDSDLQNANRSILDVLKDLIKIYEMGKSGAASFAAQGQAIDGFTQLYNYNELAKEAKQLLEHCD